MATRTSVGTGLWSVAGTWDTGVPVNGDTAVIANTHNVTFDVDQSGFAAGVTLTINAGGTLTGDTASSPYFKAAANVTVNGTWQIGTSEGTPYPTAKTFTIDMGSASRYISVGSAGKIYFYCKEPTIKYVRTTGAEAIGQTVLEVDTDVTGDSEWAAAKEIGIADIASGSRDVEYRTIAGGGIAAGAITVTSGLTNAKDSGSYIALVTRNIRVINSTYTSPVFLFNAATTGCYVGAEIRTPRAFSSGVSNTYAGVLATTSTSITSGSNHTINSVVIHASIGTSSCDGFTLNGYFFGNSIANSSSRAFLYGSTSLVAGCGNASSTSGNCRYLGTINACTTGIYLDAGPIIYGTITNCTSYGVQGGSGHIFANATLNNTIDLYQVQSGLAFNTSFSGATEFSDYGNVAARGQNAYFESQDHDATVNAIKGWPTGGIVTSQTVGPPTGYDRWYEHACESATVPCFRQYRLNVGSGETLVVSGLIRIADGENLTATPPALQIIDYFDDPLVDSTSVPLDECEIPDPSGADTDWQPVAVAWQNDPASAPKVVWVRVIAWSDSTPNTNVDECIQVVDTASQVSEIYTKLPTNYIMGSSDVDDHDTTIDTINTNIGSPANIDTGGATIAANLKKIADDNAGVDFDATRHSLYALRNRGDAAWVTGSNAAAENVYTIDTIVRTVGDNDGGVSSDVNTVNGILFSTGEVNSTTKLEVDATFTVAHPTEEHPSAIKLWGYYTGSGTGHGIRIQAYNYTDSTYEDVGSLTAGGTAVTPYTFGLTPQHINTSTGAMAIKFLHNTVGTGILSHALHIDKLIVTTSEIGHIETDVQTLLVNLATAQADLDILTGSDGATLSTAAVTAIWAKAMSDLAAGAPSATASALTALNYLYEYWRNKVVTDSTNNEIVVYKDDGTTKLCESDINDDGTLFTKGKFGAAD